MPTSLTDRRRAIEQQTGTRAGSGSTSVLDFVRDSLPQFVAALPANTIDPQRFVRIAITLLRERPALQQANRYSLMGALMHAAQMGLEIGGSLSEFYLTGPFKMKSGELEVVPIVGYRGLIAVCLRDPRVLSVKGDVVRDGDTFEYAYGDDEFLRHVPRLDNFGAPVVAAWAQAKLVTTGGERVNLHKVIGRQEIDAARGRAKASDSGPWVTDFAQMARKTAIRRFLTSGEVPMALEVRRAVALDEAPVRFDVDAGEVTAADDTYDEPVEPVEQEQALEQPESEPPAPGDAS